MANYRIFVADLLTNTFRDEVPVAPFAFKHVLNRPGALAATLGLRDAKATKANFDPGKTAIYIDRDGVLMAGGILWTADPKQDAGVVDFGGMGFLSYFGPVSGFGRFIRDTKVYTQQDQLFIARDLINYAQGFTSGDIGIQVGSETSGVLRDRTYHGYERKNIQEAIEQLAGVDGGFDFAIDVEWQSGTPAKIFRPAYPQRGRRTSLVFELGSNIELITDRADATRLARVVDAIGSGEGETMLITTVQDGDFGGYPRLETVRQWKDISVRSTLEAHARNWLGFLRKPVEVVSVRVIDTKTAPLGSWITGDEVTVRGSDGYISINGLFRILGYGVQVDENGTEAITIDFASLEAL